MPRLPHRTEGRACLWPIGELLPQLVSVRGANSRHPSFRDLLSWASLRSKLPSHALTSHHRPIRREAELHPRRRVTGYPPASA